MPFMCLTRNSGNSHRCYVYPVATVIHTRGPTVIHRPGTTVINKVFLRLSGNNNYSFTRNSCSHSITRINSNTFTSNNSHSFTRYNSHSITSNNSHSGKVNYSHSHAVSTFTTPEIPPFVHRAVSVSRPVTNIRNSNTKLVNLQLKLIIRY